MTRVITRKGRRKPRRVAFAGYTLLDEIAASPTEPTPLAHRTYQLTRMWQGLAALETGGASNDDWRVVSDAVNLLETLVEMGNLQDASGMLPDAIAAMATAGVRALKGDPLKVPEGEWRVLRGALEDYAAALEALAHRTVVRAHRRTDARILAIKAGRSRSSDVEVVSL